MLDTFLYGLARDKTAQAASSATPVRGRRIAGAAAGA
jgi:hypothetical protein